MIVFDKKAICPTTVSPSKTPSSLPVKEPVKRRLSLGSFTDESTSFEYEDTIANTKEVIRRRVRFATDHEVHECPWVLVNDFDDTDIDDETLIPSNGEKIQVNLHSIWYHEYDISQFRYYVKVFSQCVVKAEAKQAAHRRKQAWRQGDTNGGSPTWSEAIWQAYKGFHDYKDDVERVQSIMETADDCPMDALVVGLEKWALPDLRPSRGHTRRVLYRTIRRIQKTGYNTDPDTLAQRIRRVSRDITRPTRLFGIYLGRLGVRDDC